VHSGHLAEAGPPHPKFILNVETDGSAHFTVWCGKPCGSQAVALRARGPGLHDGLRVAGAAGEEAVGALWSVCP
jgi:hypothetical protein